MRLRVMSVIAQALLVLILGTAFGLAANALSPRGLTLQRDYFPNSAQAPSSTSPAPSAPVSVAHGDTVKNRLREQGIGTVSTDELLALTRDPLYAQRLIVAIDARDDRHFTAGHIAGALQLDRYYPDRYLPEVLAAAVNAEKIVVYCNGGSCEDSEFAAIMLKEAGIPPERIFVYPGGVQEWQSRQLPLDRPAP